MSFRSVQTHLSILPFLNDTGKSGVWHFDLFESSSSLTFKSTSSVRTAVQTSTRFCSDNDYRQPQQAARRTSRTFSQGFTLKNYYTSSRHLTITHGTFKQYCTNINEGKGHYLMVPIPNNCPRQKPEMTQSTDDSKGTRHRLMVRSLNSFEIGSTIERMPSDLAC